MKKVLIVETNVEKYGNSYEATGLWLGEAAEFVDELNKAGVQYDFVSPKGGYVPIDPRSMKYVDESIMKIYSNQDFIVRGLSNTLSPKQVNPADYFAIYYTDGHGVMWDFYHSEEIERLASEIYENEGFLLSVCHGIAGLLNIKDEAGNYYIKDKNITGFTKTEEILARKTKIVPFFNEVEAIKRGANFKKKRFYKEFAIKDGRIITGQNPFSVRAVAKQFLEEVK